MNTQSVLPTWDDYAFKAAIAGPFENQILYRMSRDHPSHDDPYVTAGKIMAIGRIYAASPERRAGSAERPGQTLPEAIGVALAASDLDAELTALPFQTRLSADLVSQVSEIHGDLVGLITKTTKAWSSKTALDENWRAAKHSSFASKYLHFHRPNAFPINDQFVRAGLQCLNGVGTTTYARLCRSVLEVAAGVAPDWTPRSLDTILLAAGRVHSARGNSPCPQCGQRKRRGRPR